MSQPKGPVCQSCSMPLTRLEDFGTDAQGDRVKDYCHYCVGGGKFTDPACTLPQMIERLSQMSDKMGMSRAQARQLAGEVLPRLKRWQGSGAKVAVVGSS